MNYVMFGEMSFLNIRFEDFHDKILSSLLCNYWQVHVVTFVTCIFVTLAMCFYYQKN